MGAATYACFRLCCVCFPQDMEALDPTYYKSLMDTLKYPLDDLGLEMYFSIDIEEFEQRREVRRCAASTHSILAAQLTPFASSHFRVLFCGFFCASGGIAAWREVP